MLRNLDNSSMLRLMAALKLLLILCASNVSSQSRTIGASTLDDAILSDTSGSTSGESYKSIDDSWPTHHMNIKPDRLSDFRNYMEGCYEYYKQHRQSSPCILRERMRMQSNLRQPKRMHNFTELGYQVVDIPNLAWGVISKRFDDCKSDEINNANTALHKWSQECWDPTASVAADFNTWSSPTYYLDIADSLLTSSELELVQDSIQDVVERWAGNELMLTDIDGLRAYTNNALIPPRVDELPFVVSTILRISGKNDEDEWPIVAVGHDGRVVNITLQYGQMLIYEGHSVIHGRPYPLLSRNAYVETTFHYEPINFAAFMQQHMGFNEDDNERDDVENDDATADNDALSSSSLDAKNAFERAIREQGERTESKHVANKYKVPRDIPSYLVVKGSTLDQSRWRQEFVFERSTKKAESSARTAGVTEAHRYAAMGNLRALKELVDADPSVLTESDSNGWRVIHEAARAGQVEVLRYLIEIKTSLNTRTNFGAGGSALWWAEHSLASNHPAIKLLRDNGAKSIPPSV